jgi:hypothetical protein
LHAFKETHCETREEPTRRINVKSAENRADTTAEDRASFQDSVENLTVLRNNLD